MNLSRIQLVACLALLVSICSAQSRSPVTIAEADVVFQRLDASIRDVLAMKKLVAKPYGLNVPITRTEVIARLDALFESYKPHFQFTPRPFRTAPDIAKQFNSTDKTQKQIEKLARWGFVAPVGPVVTSANKNLTMQQFADALGYFMSQTAALTYFADPKWVPNLQPPGIDGD